MKNYSYKCWLDHEEDDRPIKGSEESKRENQYKCFNCTKPTVPIYMMQFLCKDEQTMGFEKIYKIFFYTYFNNGTQADDFFAGIKATDLYNDVESRKKIEKMLSIITKFNVQVEAIVHKKYAPIQKTEIFELSDCTLNSIDDLEHKLSNIRDE